MGLSLSADELLQVFDKVIQIFHVAFKAPAQSVAPLIVAEDWDKRGR